MKLLFVTALAGLVANSFAQAPDFGGKEQIEKLKALSFLEGRWEGEATLNAPGRKLPAKGHELVEFKAGGTCAVISARWTTMMGDREVPIHEPCAMLYWDNQKKSYRMLAQLANGMRNDFDVTVKEKGFVWTLVHPQMGEIRYTMNLLDDGTWHEVGEHKTAEGKWETMLEMKLKKVKS